MRMYGRKGTWFGAVQGGGRDQKLRCQIQVRKAKVRDKAVIPAAGGTGVEVWPCTQVSQSHEEPSNSLRQFHCPKHHLMTVGGEIPGALFAMSK